MIVSNYRGFREDAQAAMTASPSYFLSWYTFKSLALVASVATVAYLIGRSK
jgi:hypothetical protein